MADFPHLRYVQEFLNERFGAGVLGISFEKSELAVKIKREALFPVLTALRDEQGFNVLDDIVGLDNLRSAAPGQPRFSLLYLLYQFPGFSRLRVAVDVGEGEEAASVTPLYRSADWAEREIFDMFGIRFAGHPDPRRIYMPDDFEGHPLRKDYPLEGT